MSRRVLGATHRGYAAVAYLWDVDAYDEGPIRYTKIFEVRDRLARLLKLVGERRYAGSKEHVALTLFRVRQR